MNPLFRTHANIRWLLAINMLIFTTQAVTAQCPAGSIVNGTGTITNGTTTCITGAVSGAVQINNGGQMVVINGGNYTGNLSTNQGSIIQIQVGGQFAPSQANSFSSSITNNGTVVMNNVSLSNGAAIANSGSFTWASSWNQNVTLTVSNTACGTMTFSQGTNVGSSATINNNGVLNFSQSLTTSSGTTIDNRGRVTVSGDVNIAGTLKNQNIAVFQGSNNTFSGGSTSDSLINLGKLTVSNSLTSSIGTRNEGLMRVHGSYTINGSTFRIDNSNAQLRIGGAFSNNGQLTGNGSLHVAGSIGNNQTIAGYGAGAQRLNINQAVTNGTFSNLNVNAGLVAADTTTYVPTMANPDICTVLPLKLSSLQANYYSSQVQLNWFAYAQSNARSFTIEYSQDGQAFTAAGELAATGNDNQTTSYSYMHTPGITGTVFYRIRETDYYGNMYYSNMVAVRTGNTLLTSEVFPNPFTDILQISMQLEKAGMIQVALYDAGGRLVRKLQQSGLTGRNTIVMSNLSALLPGTYLVQVKAGENTSFRKLAK
ncbi:T9SS type A sorting domain-containing protein [Niastella vici]|nr:T9SS type A sorting domain-containing protein [Niastella vici]